VARRLGFQVGNEGFALRFIGSDTDTPKTEPHDHLPAWMGSHQRHMDGTAQGMACERERLAFAAAVRQTTRRVHRVFIAVV
jgi:hypothetical protein